MTSIFKSIDNADEKLKKWHDKYQERIEYIGISRENQDAFIWANNKKINLYFVEMYPFPKEKLRTNFRTFVIFAKSSVDNRNHIFYTNQVNQTHAFYFEKNQFQAKNILSKLSLNNDELKKLVCKIDEASTQVKSFINLNDFESYISDWVDKEYTNMNNFLSTHPTFQINFSNKRFYVDRYHFDEMLQNINNKQFSSEFNEIIQVYEQGLWFVCATSLGSILEYLMYLTIKSYNDSKMFKALGTHPTLDNYMRVFRLPPISIDMRQESYIRAIFMLRNSVSHYNSGYTSKETCNIMFDGLTMIYNNFYLKSLEYKS